MRELKWLSYDHYFGFPLQAMRHHAVVVGSSGSGKTETLLRIAYGSRKVHHLQVIYLDGIVNFVWNPWIAGAFCRLILSSMPGGVAETHGLLAT